MSGYEWDFRAAFLHPELWVKALSVTLGYAVATTVLGLLLGVICGMMLLNRYWVFRAPVSAFVQVFRCTPLLIQIIWFYYALPVAVNLTIPAWLAAGMGRVADFHHDHRVADFCLDVKAALAGLKALQFHRAEGPFHQLQHIQAAV